MENLLFDKLPHYIFSANRQFEKGECHMDRIADLNILILMRQGILRFTENGTPVELQGGEYYIQKVGLEQHGEVPSDSPNYYFVHFSDAAYGKGGGLPLRGTYDLEKIQPIITEFEQLGNAAEKLEYEQLFYKLLCTLRSFSRSKSAAERIRAHLLENFSRDVSLEEISKLCFISKNQAINVFRETYGVTPYRYLLDFRLRRAGELLLATNSPVTEIGFGVGFSVYSAFYRVFKKKYGLSPAEYRQLRLSRTLPEDLYFKPE